MSLGLQGGTSGIAGEKEQCAAIPVLQAAFYTCKVISCLELMIKDIICGSSGFLFLGVQRRDIIVRYS